MTYDPNNIFARILRGEVPCNKVYESDHALAFHDLFPKAPVHVLVIPKGAYVSISDFGQKAPAEEVKDFFESVAKVAEMLGLNAKGYRILSNCGGDAGQEVPHFHVHVFGGKPLGPMLSA